MFESAKHIFVVGIGGIGISALARILHAQRHKVAGSDLVESELIRKLENEGIKTTIGHRSENLPSDTELLIYSVAVPENNPERKHAAKLNIQQLSYPQAVGEWSENKKVIAVAGTNGKTTTAAMIAIILEKAGFDPTAIVGSKVLAWDSNARVGKSDFLVLEADEYRRAFLNYHSDIAVITNIEADHLDYYKDLEDIKSAFLEFSGQIRPGGILIYNESDPNTETVARRFIGEKRGFNIFNMMDTRLRIPGEFNKANAAAAVVACEALGIPKEAVAISLEKFTGTWRRFERVGKLGNTEIISDYAHHPTAVRLTLDTAKEVYPGKKILAVFQPHQHNRTMKLFKEFVNSFCNNPLNDFIIAEIFEVPGREDRVGQDISSRDLVREIQKCGKKVTYAKDLEDCEQKVREIVSDYDMIIFMGAGDIYKIADKLVEK